MANEQDNVSGDKALELRPYVRNLLEFLKDCADQYQTALSVMAYLLGRLEEFSFVLPALGYSSPEHAAVELAGLTTSEARWLLRAQRALRQLEATVGNEEDANLVYAIPLDVAHIILDWPREEQIAVLRLASSANRAEVLRFVRKGQRFRRSRKVSRVRRRLEPIEPIVKPRGGNVADIIIEERR